MISGRWETGCISAAILIAIGSLAFGGIWQIVIPTSAVLAAIATVWKHEGSDLYILAVGQVLVYGASYGSFFAAVICEVSLFAAIAGNTHIKLLIGTFITFTILGIVAEVMYHTGWWIAGLVTLCTILFISGYTRKEALSRSLRGISDE
ncbi:hypothetical protein [Methanogenium organophilum]|uniref:Uncharacterized protein n=1 Tax=Methanogenium organophilum TaxID=2199 RepID=A0A9X9S3A1_METOG|nr:hypothetical protein [Methanogenium organophilum]WAI00697.1 hypothetical protein OU421_09710 [Methanogenium organophilum]